MQGLSCPENLPLFQSAQTLHGVYIYGSLTMVHIVHQAPSSFICLSIMQMYWYSSIVPHISTSCYQLLVMATACAIACQAGGG